MATNNEWDVEKLKQDIEKYTEIRDNLLSTVSKMEQAKQSADETLKNITEEDNIWKDRCLQQQEENKRLQEKLGELQSELKKLKMGLDDDVPGQPLAPTKSRLHGMSDIALRQLLKRLEKEKTETEWKLKEYGWRLDQASAALCKAKEEKSAINTQIGAAVAQLKDIQKAEEEAADCTSQQT